MYLYINSDISHKSPPTYLPTYPPTYRSIYPTCISVLSFRRKLYRPKHQTAPLTTLYFMFYVTRWRISPFCLAEVSWKDVEDNYDGHLNRINNLLKSKGWKAFLLKKLKKKNQRKHFLCSLQDYKAADLTTASPCLLLWGPQLLISQTSIQMSSPCSIGITPWETWFALDKD